MPDYAPNFTCRYKVRYTTIGRTHTMQFRVARGTTDPTGIATKVSSFLGALESQLFTDWTIVTAMFAQEDTDVFLPAPVPTGVVGAVSPAAFTSAIGAQAISFVGRSALGQRGSLYVYGTTFAPDYVTTARNDFRVTAAESTLISDAVAALDELSPALVGSDNQPMNWYGYVNTKYNDYWVGKARNG